MPLSAEQEGLVVHNIAAGIRVIGAIARVEEKVEPYAAMLAFIPGVGAVVSALAIAQPWIDRAAALAPTVANAVDQHGVQVIDAVREHAPAVIGHMKNAIAILKASNPSLSHLTAADITDAMAIEMFSALFSANYFTPQDPRFDRGDPSKVGG